MLRIDLRELASRLTEVELLSWDPTFRFQLNYFQCVQSLGTHIVKTKIFFFNGRPRLLHSINNQKHLIIDFYCEDTEAKLPYEADLLAWLVSDALKFNGQSVKRDTCKVNSIDVCVRSKLDALKFILHEFQTSSNTLAKIVRKLKLKKL